MSLVLGRALGPIEWVVLLSATAVALRFAAQALPPGRSRWASIFLRVSIALGIWTLFLRPSWVRVERERIHRRLPVLVDRSMSMGLPVQKGHIRWEEVQRWLHDAPFWETLKKEFDVEFFSFSEEASPTSLEALQSLKAPVGEETHLRKVLKSWEGGTSLAGLVVVTDGVDTDPSVDEKLVAGQIPIVALHPRSPAEYRDAAVRAVHSPDYGYYKNRFTLEAEIEVAGLPHSDVRVRVRQEDRTLVETTLTDSSWEGNRARVPLSFTPDRVGSMGVTVEVIPFPTEVTYDNNQKPVVFRVLRDRTRILHVAGRPDWDERFLRAYLKENPNLDLVSFFILRSPTDDPEADPASLSLIPFPYQDLFTKELSNFDVIVFQNFDSRTYFPPLYLANIRKYVEEGGNFVMIGGDRSFGHGGYRGTDIEEILPVFLRDDPEEVQTSPFHPTLTSIGARHPILAGRVRPSDLENFPAFWGNHRVQALKPDGVALLSQSNERNSPVLAVRQVEKGRVAALLIDSSWRWAFSTQPRASQAYRDLWNGLLSWLVRDPSSSLIQFLPIDGIKAGVEREGTLRVMNENYEPASGVVVVLETEMDGDRKSVKLEAADSRGETRFQVLARNPGLVHLTATVPKKEDRGYAAQEYWAVSPKNIEFERQDVDLSFLEQLTKQSQGAAVPLENITADKMIASLNQKAAFQVVGKTEIPLWDHSLVLLMILAASAVEWGFRRRRGAS